jgi:excisionase family DNA binding protein
MTVREAAAELGINSQRVRALINEKRLRAKITPRGYVIRAPDLDAVRVRRNGRPPKEKL